MSAPGLERPRSGDVGLGLRRLAAGSALATAVMALAVVVVISGGPVPARSSGSSRPGAAKSARPARPAVGAARSRERDAAAVVASGGGALTADPKPVPILMYHVIGEPAPDAANPDLFVSREDFASAMDGLDRNGFEAETLDQVWAAWHGDGKLPKRPVVVSFDDGYGSHYYNALPILKRHGWAGVLNLQVNSVEVSHDLERSEVRKLIAAGWEIDSHTISHEDVTTLDSVGLEREIADSRRQLRQAYGVSVNFFCYPAGQFNDAAIEAVKRAGYLGATTVEEGLAGPDPPYAMSRMRVHAGDGGAEVMERLAALAP
jgi:peptidoglycan/xylan/chitin deacetylase (PgdA/CDA1 family)